MFTQVKNTKIYEHIIEQFKIMIANGTLNKGDKLPSERELVNQFGVSRASIREALSALQMIGLVEARQGEGNFIKDRFEESLIEPISLIFMLHHSTGEEVLEFRKVMEIETAAIAAKKITDEEIEELRVCVQNLKEVQEEELKVQYDKKFHYVIAKASKNILIINMLFTISSLMDYTILEARSKILSVEENKEILVKHHEEIFEAICNHNPKLAADSMRRHLEFAHEYIMKE